MDELWHFLILHDTNVRYVVLGCMTLGAVSGLVGSFSFLRKQSLVGDAVAHGLLPGVCVAFLFAGEKNYAYLLVGAFISGGLALFCVQSLTKASKKLKEDTVIALVLSVFFGGGIFMLTQIQRSNYAAQTGLDSFLFGHAAALLSGDVLLFFLLSIAVLLSILLFFKEFALLSFDALFGRSMGIPMRWLNTLLTLLTLACIVLGIQAVGVVLIIALLITPATVARFWVSSLRAFVWTASLVGCFSGLVGAFISYTLPHMPTGPWIVIVLALLVVFSLFFSPTRGLVVQAWRHRRSIQRSTHENILKGFYLQEEGKEIQAHVFGEKAERIACKQLAAQGMLERITKTAWQLSPKGREKAKIVVRRHRLWELYLSNHLDVPVEEVHEKAERIEHLITEKLDKDLSELMEEPSKDPHKSSIPPPTYGS